MNDSELDDLLRQSQSTPEFSSSFQREIWARIAVAEQASWFSRWARWSDSLYGNIARPAPAFATVMVMLLLGAGLGRIPSDERGQDASRETYLASINPLVAAASTNAE